MRRRSGSATSALSATIVIELSTLLTAQGKQLLKILNASSTLLYSFISLLTYGSDMNC
jgi:hypothetical protein